MKRPIFGVDWTGNLKRQAAKDSHDDMASQSTSAPSSSSLSQFSQDEVLSQNIALPIKDEMSWSLRELAEHADVKQEKPEQSAEATASYNWADWEADVKQEKFEESEEATASNNWADWEADVKQNKLEESEEATASNNWADWEADVKQNKLEESEEATASNNWADWEADVKQEKFEESEEATASNNWADWEADVKQEKFEVKEELQNGECEAAVQDDAQQSPGGQPQIRKKDLTAADIVELLRNGHFAKLARNLENEIGIQDSQWERSGRAGQTYILLHSCLLSTQQACSFKSTRGTAVLYRVESLVLETTSVALRMFACYL
eukprot:s1457_g13.t1